MLLLPPSRVRIYLHTNPSCVFYKWFGCVFARCTIFLYGDFMLRNAFFFPYFSFYLVVRFSQFRLLICFISKCSYIEREFLMRSFDMIPHFLRVCLLNRSHNRYIISINAIRWTRKIVARKCMCGCCFLHHHHDHHHGMRIYILPLMLLKYISGYWTLICFSSSGSEPKSFLLNSIRLVELLNFVIP